MQSRLTVAASAAADMSSLLHELAAGASPHYMAMWCACAMHAGLCWEQPAVSFALKKAKTCSHTGASMFLAVSSGWRSSRCGPAWGSHLLAGLHSSSAVGSLQTSASAPGDG